MRIVGGGAWSCDLLPADDGSAFHIHGDVREALAAQWDMGIFHPPCTYLTVAANKWMKPQFKERFPDRHRQREEAIQFVRMIYAQPFPLAIENPISVLSSRFRKPDQVIQPWMFGHGEVKATCLWLKGLRPLRPTTPGRPTPIGEMLGEVVTTGRDDRLHRLPPSPTRWKERSRTFQGIANAMANQWGSR